MSSNELRRGSVGKNVPAERVAGIAIGVVFVGICLGCMSIGGRTEVVQREDPPAAPTGTITQSGNARLSAGQELDIFYPAPFASIPNLEMQQHSPCTLVEQKSDHFRVKNPYDGDFDVSWTARGVPMPTPSLQVSVSSAPPAPIPTGITSPNSVGP